MGKKKKAIAIDNDQNYNNNNNNNNNSSNHKNHRNGGAVAESVGGAATPLFSYFSGVPNLKKKNQ